MLTIRVIDYWNNIITETTETEPTEARRHIDHWILNADDNCVAYVEVPELGVKVSPKTLVRA